MEILKVENLYSGYSNFVVLKNISFIVEEGQFIGIIGPNASGKTTLLKTICKILPVLKGKILVFGKDIKNYSYKEYAKLVAFATNVTDYSMNYRVKDFISLARYPWNFNPYNEKELYKEFELEEILDKQLFELSSGELQRVIVAQSLAQTTKLLVLDEPVSHLDIGHQIKILDILKNVNKREGLTIIASFHELNLAAEYCDILILLSCGEIKKIGKPTEVLDYKVLEEVYNIQVVVKNNPISDKPYVFPVPMMWKNSQSRNLRDSS